MRLRIALTMAISCGVMSSASSSCTLDTFGNHRQPPTPIRPPPVDNNYGHFSFGSDVWTDPKTGDYYAWNFIENDDTRDLAVDWPKAGIHHISAPILAGHNDCIWNPLAVGSESGDFRQYIDHDAPIKYSSAKDVEQKAWVYSELAGAPGGGATAPKPEKEKQSEPTTNKKEFGGALRRIFSRFTTTFADKDGEKHDIAVTITSEYTSENLTLGVVTGTPYLTIGIAKLQDLLGDNGFKVAEEQFRKDGFEVGAKAYYEILDNDMAN